jgi:hypothetical protein
MRDSKAARRWRRSTKWFAEGVDTADLKDAKAMLDELDCRKTLYIRSCLPRSRSSIWRHLRPWQI